MTNEWHELLSASSAVQQSTTESISALAGYVANDTPQLTDLSGYRVFEISGGDATAFLQGQFCNDIAGVSSTQAQITGYCTPKGRLLALPTIVGANNNYRMLVPDNVAEAFIKRLSMFVMRSDVTITPLNDWVVVGVTADASGSVGPLSEHLPELPTEVLSATGEQSTDDPGQTIRWHDDVTRVSRQRYLRLAPLASQKALWNAIDNDEHKHAQASWRLADISAGIPSITEGIVEAFVPQMLNLQLINALSFTKGCYPGQEIVARMQYLGKLKRHMRVFTLALDGIDVNALLKPGVTLSLDADENAGIVIDAMPYSSDKALVLAVTKVTPAQSEFALAGTALEARNMPYELPSLEVA